MRLWLNPSLFHIVVFFMSYCGWFVLNIAVRMLQFYSGRSILLITRLNNSLGLFTICDKRQLERKATCSLVTLKPIYHNNPAKGWLKRCVLGKIQIPNLMKKYYLEFRTHFLRLKFVGRTFARDKAMDLRFFFKEPTVNTGT